MTTILYPLGDYYAADIAVKVKALAVGQGKKIKIIPKHYGRNIENVYNILGQSNLVLFIAHDKKLLDSETKNELDFLTKNNKTVIAVIPQSMYKSIGNIYSPLITFYPYHDSDKTSLVRTITTLVADLPKLNNTNSLFTLLAILAIIILLLGTISNEKSISR